MSEHEELERQIQARLNRATARACEHQSHAQQRMAEVDRKSVRFNEIARPLVERQLRPRLQKAASFFDNAEVAPLNERSWNHCTAAFKHTERFPASTRLDLFVIPDDKVDNLVVVYDLSIIPIFFQFEGHDTLAIPVDQVDESSVARWVDRKLIEFVETYLRLEQADEYQRENFVTDPVCGMRINRNSAASQVQLSGVTYYFCIDECRRRFEESPEKYVSTK